MSAPLGIDQTEELGALQRKEPIEWLRKRPLRKRRRNPPRRRRPRSRRPRNRQRRRRRPRKPRLRSRPRRRRPRSQPPLRRQRRLLGVSNIGCAGHWSAADISNNDENRLAEALQTPGRPVCFFGKVCSSHSARGNCVSRGETTTLYWIFLILNFS